MRVTYKDAEENVTQFLKARESREKLSMEIEGELKQLSAFQLIDALDRCDTLSKRAEIVRSLIAGCTITIFNGDTVLTKFTATPGFQFFADPVLDHDPFVAQFFVDTVWGMMLKNSVMHSVSTAS